MHIRTETQIASSKESVWKKLVTFSDYQKWNKFIVDISGELKVGSKLNVKIILPGKTKPNEFKPTVSLVDPGTEFRWVGKLLFERLFKGEHYFRLETSPAGTKLIHGERFSGLLARVILYFIKDDTQKGFEAMNTHLQEIIQSEALLDRPDTSDLYTSPAHSMRALTQFIVADTETKSPLMPCISDHPKVTSALVSSSLERTSSRPKDYFTDTLPFDEFARSETDRLLTGDSGLRNRTSKR